jgi:UDP-glucuronate 4-epimerase
MRSDLLKGKKILMTGLTGSVTYLVAKAFAKESDVWGIARFSDPAKKESLEAEGITCIKGDLGDADYFDRLPNDFDYLINFAVSFDPSFDEVFRASVEGLGLLINHCRNVKAFFHCSTSGVYQSNNHEELKETDLLGDNSQVILPTYSIQKAAAEGIARFTARLWNLPTVIARLSVPYGDNGGWPAMHFEQMLAGDPIPVHTNKPSEFRPIHTDDIARTVPMLLENARVPATIVNWGGEERVSIEQWCGYIGELTGIEPKFNYTDQCLESGIPDLTKMHSLIGNMEVNWKDGIRRMMKSLYPDRLL